MKKTKPLIRILLGFSTFMLFITCLKFIDGNMDKFYLRLGIALIILLGLYLKEFKIKNNFLTSLKDSVPFFIVMFLFSFGTWISISLSLLLYIWDFGGDGWGGETWIFKKR